MTPTHKRCIIHADKILRHRRVEVPMGTFKKIAAMIMATVILVWFTALFGSVMVVNQKVPTWSYWIIGVAELVFLGYYLWFARFLFKTRCADCGSWNTWRNIFPQNTGEDYSINGLYHRRRSTYCYKCHSDSNIQHWTYRDPFS